MSSLNASACTVYAVYGVRRMCYLGANLTRCNLQSVSSRRTGWDFSLHWLIAVVFVDNKYCEDILYTPQRDFSTRSFEMFPDDALVYTLCRKID